VPNPDHDPAWLYQTINVQSGFLTDARRAVPNGCASRRRRTTTDADIEHLVQALAEIWGRTGSRERPRKRPRGRRLHGEGVIRAWRKPTTG